MTSTALITSTDKLPAHLQGIGGLGNENLDADTLTTPRLYLLQALSEQVIKGNPNYVKNATAGMYLNSLTNELYEELFVANLFFSRGFNVNKRREFGQKDWRGFFPTSEAAYAKLQNDGVNPSDYDVTDTHTHTLALIDPVNGTIITPIQFSMKGSALRDSRQWNTNIMAKSGDSMPRFAGIWKMDAKLNTNAKGSWYTPQVSFAGWAPAGLFDELTTLFKKLYGNVAQTAHEDVLF